MRHSRKTDPTEHVPDIDEKYWRKAILQKSYYRPEVGVDRYVWALRFGQMARQRHHGCVEFADVMKDLAETWKQFGGPSGMTWDEARAAIEDSWGHTGTLQGEAIAARGGFDSPPNFKDHGNLVPRNTDEANS